MAAWDRPTAEEATRSLDVIFAFHRTRYTLLLSVAFPSPPSPSSLPPTQCTFFRSHHCGNWVDLPLACPFRDVTITSW